MDDLEYLKEHISRISKDQYIFEKICLDFIKDNITWSTVTHSEDTERAIYQLKVGNQSYQKSLFIKKQDEPTVCHLIVREFLSYLKTRYSYDGFGNF